MLFRKEKKSSDLQSYNIALIGNSPLAYTLGAILLYNKHNVTFISSQKSSDINYKISADLNYHFDQHDFNNSPSEFDYTILASSPCDINNDLLLLSSDIKSSPLYNFSYFYNSDIINELHPEVINCISDAVFFVNKHEIKLLPAGHHITLLHPTKQQDILSLSFKPNQAEITFLADYSKFVLQHKSSYFLSNLVALYSSDKISALFNDEDFRSRISLATKELKLITKTPDISINTSSLLAEVYNTSDKFSTDINNPQAFSNFLKLFPGVNAFDTPVIFDFISKVTDKILA